MSAERAGRSRPVLVFDLDGTLTDPFEGIWRSTNHALTGYGAAPVERDDFLRFIGPPIDQTFRTLLPGIGESEVMDLVTAFRQRYGELGYAENVLYPGIPELLERLNSAGFPCGVCTAKRVDFAQRVLELFRLDGYFGFVDGGDVGVRKASQLERLLQSGTIGADAIMIGDRASDLEAAAANALTGIGVAWGYGPEAELSAAKPRAIVAEPAELGRLLLAG